MIGPDYFMKKCSKCKEIKKLNEFYSHSRSKDGFGYSCKFCLCFKQGLYRKANPEKAKQANANWRKANSEKVKADKKAWFKANPRDRAKTNNLKKIWRKKNPDREKVGQKVWYQKNKEKSCARSALWRRINPEKVKNKMAIWQKNNPDKVCALSMKRRAAKLKRTPSWLTKEHFKQIEEFYTLAKELQWLSDITDPLQVDHIIPLQGKNVSGLHVPWNLQILPRSLNVKKNNRFME